MEKINKLLNLNDLYSVGCLLGEQKKRIEKAVKDGVSIVIVGRTKGGKTALTRCITNTIDDEKSVLFLSCDGDITKEDFTDRVGLKIATETFNGKLLDRIGCDVEAFDVMVVDELRPLLVNTGEDVNDVLKHYIKEKNKQFIASVSKPLGNVKLQDIIKSNLPEYVDMSKLLIVSIAKVDKKPIVDFVGYMGD